MTRTRANLVLALVSLVLSLLLAEATLRFLTKPSAISSGQIFGRELPPIKIMPTQHQAAPLDGDAQNDLQFGSLVVDGTRVTHSDLFGLMREDPLLAYVPRENARSTNGWWQSNNLGARQVGNSDRAASAQRRRILFFGDSYTQGSRVQQHQTFQAALEVLKPEFEILNFGVDGYSTGQAHLRFRMVEQQIEFQQAVLVTVPSADLWRDISVSRYFGDRWNSYKLQPRYYLEGDRLQLAQSPFESLAAQVADGPDFSVARQHLLRYDAFYFDEYEPGRWSDSFVLTRLARGVSASMKRRAIRTSILSPSGEAVQVTQGIIREFNRDMARRGGSFVLVVLPIYADILSFQSDEDFKKAWIEMSARLCASASRCIDLMEPLAALPATGFDFGYDGSHYGPRANQLIASLLARAEL